VLTAEQQEFLRSLLSRARIKTGAKINPAPTTQVFVDEQRSGAGPDERDPAKLAGLIDNIIVNKGWDLQLATGKLRARWDKIVGSDVADHVVIEQFHMNASGQSGVLVLRADSTAWATQIKLLMPTLTQKLDDEVGQGRISEIKVLGPNAPSWKHGLRSVPGRGPRDTYG
jgi:predicted nucleic acid-binding Zn ribbon protein